MLAIVVSRADQASVHVGEHLLEIGDWDERIDDTREESTGGKVIHRTEGAELRTFDDIHLDLERPADAFDDPDLLAFASRHAGETGPLLTAHHTGNFGPAEYGGSDDSLARAAPNALRTVLSAFEEYAPERYEVGMEATHHGPSDVGAPSLFVEVGSDEEQWADPAAARAVARAILDLRDVSPDVPRTISDPDEPRASEERGGTRTAEDHDGTRPPQERDGPRRHLVGFGGGHYAPRFGRIVEETDWAIGHVAADWALETMGDPGENETVVRLAFERSDARFALLAADRPALAETIENLGYRTVGEDWVRATSGVPLDLVGRLENEMVGVGDGLRFGERATVRGVVESGGDVRNFDVVTPDPALLEAANGIDREGTRSAVAAVSVAFETEDNGARVAGAVALTGEKERASIVRALGEILEQKYDEVRRDGDEIVARRRTFDPELARDAGVPEGPKFGKLAAGEPVDVDGRTVDPADVTSERERRFKVDLPDGRK